MRTSIRRLIQAFTAVLLVTAGLFIPTESASAIGYGGSFQHTSTGWGVGVYERPDVNAPKPNINLYADLRPGGSGDGANLVCQATGTGFGGASATWYEVSSEATVNGYTQISGWVYAGFFDNGAAESWLPTCVNNGYWIQIAYPHHLGQYTCGYYAAGNCIDRGTGLPSKNGFDLDPNYYVYAQCYFHGWTVGSNSSDLWLLISNSNEWWDRTASYVYAPYLGYTNPPYGLSQCG